MSVGLARGVLGKNRLLIPLNVCRKDSFYLPWKCEDERHVFEKCVFSVFISWNLFFCGGLRLLVYTSDLVNVLPEKWNANHGWPYVRGPNSCSHAGYSEQLTNSTSECSRTRWATSRAFDVNLTTCDTSHPLAIPILFLFVVLIQHTDPFFIVRLVLLFRCQYEEYALSLFLSYV